jgi:hypothetical protein
MLVPRRMASDFAAVGGPESPFAAEATREDKLATLPVRSARILRDPDCRFQPLSPRRKSE